MIGVSFSVVVCEGLVHCVCGSKLHHVLVQSGGVKDVFLAW